MGADADDEVGLFRDDIGAFGTGHTDRAEIQTMVPGERRLAGLRLDDGDLVLLDKGLQRVCGAEKCTPPPATMTGFSPP